jgi:uncharacterized membrane protein YphA (DoxX/SURF4 family)
MQKLIKTDRASTTILIRLMVGAVFFSEGIQKFIFPQQRSTDQFEILGFAEAEIMAHYVGVFEVLAGILILMGLFTRGGALITLVITTTAIIITNMIVVVGESFYPSALTELQTHGFWGIAPEVHTDWGMWLGSLFLLLKGGGRWSADRFIYKRNYSFSWPGKN